MAKTLYYTAFETKRGWIGMLASKAGLRAVTLPRSTQQQTIQALGENVKQAVLSPELFSDLEQRFQYYYSGAKTTFNDKLDFSNATIFQKQVWEATQLIPYGETRNYGWVAKQIGKPHAARAVGQALSKNPFLIIVPCHRVIAGYGSLGGFGGGLETKQALLEMEKTAPAKGLQSYNKAIRI
jgi:methylated-DNA-[protein]-cysteine S-methyltransferase